MHGIIPNLNPGFLRSKSLLVHSMAVLIEKLPELGPLRVSYGQHRQTREAVAKRPEGNGRSRVARLILRRLPRNRSTDWRGVREAAICIPS